MTKTLLLSALPIALIAATAAASMTKPATDTMAKPAETMTKPADMPGHDMSQDKMTRGYQVYTKAAFDAALATGIVPQARVVPSVIRAL